MKDGQEFLKVYFHHSKNLIGRYLNRYAKTGTNVPKQRLDVVNLCILLERVEIQIQVFKINYTTDFFRGKNGKSSSN